MRLALFRPDIPQNTGAMLRLCACMGVGLDIIEPCGFVLDDKRLRRSAMDYLSLAAVERHSSWDRFQEQRSEGRLVLLTTRASETFSGFDFEADDTLLLGQESSGAPEYVHRAADARLRVPMAEGARSLNVAISAAMVLGEALRQTKLFPREAGSTPWSTTETEDIRGDRRCTNAKPTATKTSPITRRQQMPRKGSRHGFDSYGTTSAEVLNPLKKPSKVQP